LVDEIAGPGCCHVTQRRVLVGGASPEAGGGDAAARVPTAPVDELAAGRGTLPIR